MQDVLTKPRHTNGHCAACRPLTKAQIEGRQIARVMDAQKEAKRLYEEKQLCDHPPEMQFIKVLPAEEDENGTALDGARVKVCRICLTITGEVF